MNFAATRAVLRKVLLFYLLTLDIVLLIKPLRSLSPTSHSRKAPFKLCHQVVIFQALIKKLGESSYQFFSEETRILNESEEKKYGKYEDKEDVKL